METAPRHPIRLRRVTRVALGVSAGALALTLVPPWIRVIVSAPGNALAVRKATVVLLAGLEVAYVAVFVLAVIGAGALGLTLFRARRERNWSKACARGFLLCVGVLLAFGLAEGTALAWLASSHRPPSPVESVPTLVGERDGPSTDGEVRLAVLGESSAFGMACHPWISVGKIVAWQLGLAIRGKRFEVELVAEPGDTLEGQFRKLAGVRKPLDALIVYCGHNEFSATFPWNREQKYYVDETPSFVWGLDDTAARISPLCRLIRETADTNRVAIAPPAGTTPPPLVDAPVFTPAEFAARLEAFRTRLEAIVAYGERIGALTVLVVPPGNDGFDPNRSFLPATTPRTEREAFARDFLAVRGLEESEPVKAIALYQKLLDRQPGFAEAHYRLGVLFERAGEWDEAYRHLVAARDLDGYPMRCLSAFQQVYRDVAASRGCILVDGQALFHAIGPHGLLDDHLFNDAMHPTAVGHIALAQAVVDAMYERRAFGWPEGKPLPAIDPAACLAHFGFHPQDWKTIAERGAMFCYNTAALRFDRAQRVEKQHAFLAGAEKIGAGDAAEGVGLPSVGLHRLVVIRPGLAPR